MGIYQGICIYQTGGQKNTPALNRGKLNKIKENAECFSSSLNSRTIPDTGG
jgi:hypothetical protein